MLPGLLGKPTTDTYRISGDERGIAPPGVDQSVVGSRTASA
jgi:hypothetical protein